MEWENQTPSVYSNTYFNKLWALAEGEPGRDLICILHVEDTGWFISPRKQQFGEFDLPQPNFETAKIVAETMILLNEFPEGFM